ncbi:MAG: hypothetical protein K2N56_02370 [Oscillospiraceae bacterium]|nr:hypothetical protein [Oscillospiraceae bacterium]
MKRREIKFMFDYNCSPIWACDKFCFYLVSSEGYFVSENYQFDGKSLDDEEPEPRLKGEVELERCVRLIYETFCRIWNINNFGSYEDPYIGFEDEQEKADFFDACDYVIKRMKEIFGDEFTVHEVHERIIKERCMDCRKPN